MIRMWFHVGSGQMSPLFLLSRRKMGFVYPWDTLVSQPAVWYYVGISFNSPLLCVRFVWLVFMRPVYTLRFQNAQEGVIVVGLNGFIRYLVSLGFNLIQCLAMSWRFMFGHLGRIGVEVVCGVHCVIRTSTHQLNVSEMLVLIMYTSR